MGFFDRILTTRRCDTMFGCAHVITMPDAEGRRVRVLELDGTYQSATYEGDAWAELPFQYLRAFDAIFDGDDEGRAVRRILLMGGGGFAWPKHVLTSREGVSMDVVEIDPLIVELARKRFYLDRLEEHLADRGEGGRLSIHVIDALAFLHQTDRRYDAIVNDLFQGKDVPADLDGMPLLSAVKEHLEPDGIYAVNVVADLARTGPRELFWLMDALNDAFSHVWAVDAADESFGGADNYIVLASDADHPIRNSMDLTF